jgi:dethiobiotin synthetase
MQPRGFFITGTDTGVGKTRVAESLCHAFVARGLKVAAM